MKLVLGLMAAMLALKCGSVDSKIQTIATGTYQPSQSELEVMQAVLQLTNENRRANGCRPLAMESRLVNAAFSHTQDMVARDYFGHELAGDPSTTLPSRLERFGYRYSAAAENIAAGQRSPAEALKSWMNSSGHRANILNCKFRDIGIAVVAKNGRSLYWTQIFGSSLD